MHIIIDHSSMIPIYEQVADQIRKLVLSGELQENQLLPSVRAMSGKLKISALTVKKAYDRLEEEGIVVTVHGKGTYIASMNPSLALEERRKTVEQEFAAAVDKARAMGMTRDEILEIVQIMLEDSK